MKHHQICYPARCVLLFISSLVFFSCQSWPVAQEPTSASVSESPGPEVLPSPSSEVSLEVSQDIAVDVLPPDPEVPPLVPTQRPTEPTSKMFVDYPIAKSPQAYISTPEDYLNKGIQPGIIQVLLREEYHLRLNEEGSAFYSETHPRAAAELSAYLTSVNALSRHDSATGMTEAEVFAEQAAISRLYEGYIPLRYSLQTYTFAKETDLVPIINHLRALDFVRSAGFVFLMDLA